MESKFRYVLEPSGGGREYRMCPKCGHKRFVRYINVHNGEYLADDVGKCERENSCGYNYPPREYFRNINLKNNSMNNNEIQNNSEKQHISEIFEDRVQKNNLLSGSDGHTEGALTFWMTSVFGENITSTLIEYGLLVSKYFYKDGKSGVAFVQRDRNRKIRQVKLMAYNPHTGKRLKEGDEVLTYSYKTSKYEAHTEKPKIIFIGQYLMRDYVFDNAQCFFGENLLAQYPDKIVAIVESEKTALICAYIFPDYVWLATGGKYGCGWSKPEVYNVLRGRKSILFPDLKATADWRIRAERLCWDGLDVSVYEDLETASYVTDEDRENGLDIADFILRVKFQENPELQYISTEIPSLKKADAPNINQLLTILSSPEQMLSTHESLPDLAFQNYEEWQNFVDEQHQKSDPLYFDPSVIIEL